MVGSPGGNTGSFDVIVIGCGGVGSAALYHLAGRGLRVLGLDRFPPGHSRGSSHGDTRVIRQAYFEHADYVPLLQRAYTLWGELEADADMRLLHETGVLEIGPPDGVVVPAVMDAARQHNLDVQHLDAQALAREYPMFSAPDDYEAVFEACGGYLMVEDCVRAHARLAQARGAELVTDAAVRSWRVTGDGVEVHADGAVYRSARLIVCAGAWASELLTDLDVPLTVLRKHLHWFASSDARYRQDQGCPAYFFELDHGIYYGFPDHNGSGVKIAEHSGGEPLSDPLARSDALDPAEFERVRGVLSRHLPGVDGAALRHVACMYTMTPDAHFVVDRHPQHGHVCFAAGLSGHGFKFASVLGEILADLAIDGRSRLPIGFLSATRLL